MKSIIKGKLIVLAPYKELAEISKKVVNELNLPIEVEMVNTTQMIEKAEQLKKEGKEIIISRGGIAKVIKEVVDIPVVEIKITGYDILRALCKYKSCNKPIAVIENLHFTSGAEEIARILGLDVRCYTINKIEQIAVKVEEAINQGYEIILGGSWGVDTKESINKIRSRGIIYELIASAEESVKEAIEKACKLYEMTLSEREKKEQFKTVLDFSSEGIIAVDSDGIINTFNPVAEKIFGIASESALGKTVQEVIPKTRIPEVLRTGEIKTGIIHQIDNLKIVSNKVPIIINDRIRGVVATFQEVTKIQNLEQKIRYKLAEKGLVAKNTFSNIIGKSKAIKQTKNLAKKYSETDSTVLITGESGTGKEIFAQSIHNQSCRKNNAFVAINCSALPENLLESELFGYVEGAFTGARKGGKLGLFELAHKGTIFLDEIGEININLQTRLLRVLQEKEVMRIGDDKVIPVDIRIIAATNKDLKEEIKKGNFREDLYYRLNILNLNLPPLRERKEDIEELVNFFIDKFNKDLNCQVEKIEQELLKELEQYYWPGNIRELQNVIERIVVITREGVAQKENLGTVLNQLESHEEKSMEENILEGTLSEIETRIIKKVLEREDYNKVRTAKRLGIDRGTLNRKLQK